MISALPESGAWQPNTIGAQFDRPMISFISASFSWPYPRPPRSGPRWHAHRPAVLDLLLERTDDLLVHRVRAVVDEVRAEREVERLDTRSRTNSSIQSSCSWNSGSVEKSHAIWSSPGLGSSSGCDDHGVVADALLAGRQRRSRAASGGRSHRPAPTPRLRTTHDRRSGGRTHVRRAHRTPALPTRARRPGRARPSTRPRSPRRRGGRPARRHRRRRASPAPRACAGGATGPGSVQYSP